MRSAGLNMVQVKKQNRSSILNCIMQKGPMSRKDIAEITGLTPAAVTLICSELIQQGLLQEMGIDTFSTGAGRLAVSNMKGECLDKETIVTDRNVEPEVFLADIVTLCRRIWDRSQLGTNLTGVGVTVPGVVDRERGISVHAYGVWKRQVAVFVQSIL